MKNIIFSAGSAVHIVVPAPATFKALTHGGYGELPGDAVTADLAENEARRIEAAEAMPLQRAVDNMVRDGHDADFAARWLSAVLNGGETDAGALDMLRVKDARAGDDHAVVDADVVPSDRFFRDAWRKPRGRDGIVIDLAAARLVFAKRVIGEKAAASKVLIEQIEVAMVLGGQDMAAEAAHDALMKMDLRALGAKAMQAGSPEELMSLWPAALAIPLKS